ncbi:MAG: TadE/TadG family type IV pilus assembly protein [Gemmatimonadota bacterium]
MRPNTVRPSNRRIPVQARALIADERGAILLMVAILGVVIAGLTGMVMDLGLAYVNRAQMSRAVDAGSLAGARTLRSGEDVARDQALALAAVNGVSQGDGTSLQVLFATNAEGESTVEMIASRPMPTIFLRAVGLNELLIASSAMAAVPPVDLVLVLDQSGSLAANGAWDDLQDAAIAFIEHFDDDIDQVGLVSFALRATNRFSIGHGFTTTIENRINAMTSAGDTNAGEGLRFALGQLSLPNVRDRSVKVVVFFTDGRPTAFRGALGNNGPINGGSALGPFTSATPGVEDRIMAVYTTGNLVRGYFNNPDALPSNSIPNPNGCQNVSSCWGWDEDEVREKGRDAGLEVADVVRGQDILIYSIGLGNPNAGDPLLVPDMNYLKLIANEGGISDEDQPAGRAYFAPSPAELQAVFNQVAQDLLVRLAR